MYFEKCTIFSICHIEDKRTEGQGDKRRKGQKEKTTKGKKGQRDKRTKLFSNKSSKCCVAS